MHEAGGHLMEAVTVGVGLHHRDVAHVFGQGCADAAEVAFERAEIDFGPTTERQLVVLAHDLGGGD